MAAELRPSARGELEITDINNRYLREGRLSVRRMGRGFVWLDTGTHGSLHDAAEFVRVMQTRTGQMVGCLEEVAYRMGFIGAETLLRLAHGLSGTHYADYLLGLAAEAGD